MKIINNPSYQQDAVKKLIQQYGWAPEHNFYHFQNWEKPGSQNFVFDFNDQGAILARQEKNIWHIFSEILAEPPHKLKILEKFLGFCFDDPKTKKVVVEFESDFEQQVRLWFKDSPWRADPIDYSLVWPIFDLRRWDPALPGQEWKTLRHAKNQFYKNHRVKIMDSRDCSEESLKKIVNGWRGQRGGEDRTDHLPYFQTIENGFMGTKFRRTLVVDDIPSTITAGWEIPNQPNSYYSAVGLHNYQCEYLGEAANLDDLDFLKSQGYYFASFGGGEEALTNFKMKFKPAATYTTRVFAIKRVKKSTPRT